MGRESKITRRSSLEWLVALAALPVIGSCDRSDDWSFLNRPLITKENRQLEKATSYVPLCGEFEIPRDDPKCGRIFEQFKPRMMLEIESRGFDPKGKYEVILTQQDYGVPESSESGESMLAYCKRAVGYLYQQVRGLERHPLNWVLLKAGDNFDKDFNQNTYVGRSYYEVVRAHIKNAANEDQSFVITAADHRDGGKIKLKFDNGLKIEKWYVFMGTGLGALQTPFSEVIPLTTTSKTMEYKGKLGYEEALRADEAIAEASAYLLSLRLVKEMEVPNGEQSIQEAMKMLSEKELYKHVGKAIEWMKKNSVQAGFELYMESPEKFLRQIGAHA